MLNSPGLIRRIKLPGEVALESAVTDSVGVVGGLKRPVGLSIDKGPLPRWFASVVMRVDARVPRQIGEQKPGT